MHSFSAKIFIIGINPYVLLPAALLKTIFVEAGKDKGPITVKGTIDGHSFIQTLVKYSGKWRLYLNEPMRRACGKDVGDKATFELSYDDMERVTLMHPALEAALKQDKKATAIYNQLSPSLQKEIKRYINNLKTQASVDKNVIRAIDFLHGKERFVGRDHPLTK